MTDGRTATDIDPKGAADGDRQMVKGVHSADVIINILARRREPGSAGTITTPDALRLRHAPAADWARYDSLRRVH